MKRFSPITLLWIAVFAASACGDSSQEPKINSMPVADAGTDRMVEVGDTVGLEGSATDGDGDALTFGWSFASRPAGSNTVLSDDTVAVPAFIADVEGEYELRLLVSDGDGGVDEDFVTIEATPISGARELSGDIIADTFLHDLIPDPDRVDYVVNGSIGVTALLTIEAGTRIRFSPNTRFDVRTGGAIAAVGKEASPIIFEGESAIPGSWQGIVISSDDPRNVLDHVTVSYGGASPWSNVHVLFQAQVALRNCTLEGSQGNGLTVVDQGRISSFEANRFLDNLDAAAEMPASERAHLDAASTFSGDNGYDGVVVNGSTIETAGSWARLDAPTEIHGEVDIKAPLVIERGVEMIFSSNASFDVELGGTLTAVGTDSAPIVFRGLATAPGYWRGIRFLSDSDDNELGFVVVEHGGSGRTANVSIANHASASVHDAALNASSAAVLAVAEGGSLRAFAANTFADNGEAAVRIAANEIGMLDDASDYALNNAYNGIDVMSGVVDTPQTWRKLNGPVRFRNKTRVIAPVTVEAGAQLRFWEDARLDIEPGGSFTASGSATEPVTLLGHHSEPGYWDGIRFRSDSAANTLTHVDIGYGGGTETGNVFIESMGRAEVVDSHIHDSLGYGVVVEPGGTFVESGNTYSGNSRGNRN
jgi:hypothetical protein